MYKFLCNSYCNIFIIPYIYIKCKFYCFFIFGFAINDAKDPKNIAAAIPPADAFTPPINAPNIPVSLTDSIAPLAKFAPKPC